MKVVLLGKGEMLANLIEGAMDANAEIVGVFRYERMALSWFKLFVHDFFQTSYDLTLIKEYKLHEIKCKSANSEEFRRELLKLNIDIMFVGTWREKIKKNVYDIPKIASINVHPSFLPRYRGPNPYMQTIKNLEPYSGVTFHLIDQNFDTGAILAQQKVDILPCDTGKELREKTTFAARILISDIIKRLQHGIINPVIQDEKRASYYPNISPDEMMLDFTQKTAQEMHAHIRALHPWLPCYITIGKKFFIADPYKLKILGKVDAPAGKIIAKNPKTMTLTIVCKDNVALEMKNIKISKKSLLR